MSNVNQGVGYSLVKTSNGTSLTILQPPIPDATLGVGSSTGNPFKVRNLGKKSGVDEWYFTVVPGTVNNLTPMIGGTSWYMDHIPTSDYLKIYYQWQFNTSTHYSYVVLKTGFDSSTKKYPDDNTAHVSASPSYPVVESLTYQPTTDDTDSYIILASAYQDPTTKAITVWQYVTGSLWTDRIKVHGINAKYYWARL